MSVNSYLTNLASSLVLTEHEKSGINTSISTLSWRLAAHFGAEVVEQFQFGSSTRGTVLPRRADAKSDIDYLVVFSDSSGAYKPQTYLDRLRRFASIRYSSSEVSQSHPTVVLGLNHVSFELVPAIRGLFGFGYQIPSPPSDFVDWIGTRPNAFNDQLTGKNKGNDSKIKPLIRLVKYWNALNGYPFPSFSLEKDIVEDMTFWFSTNLWDYFHSFWRQFGAGFFSPQVVKEKVRRGKEAVADIAQAKGGSNESLAEHKFSRLLPSP